MRSPSGWWRRCRNRCSRACSLPRPPPPTAPRCRFRLPRCRDLRGPRAARECPCKPRCRPRWCPGRRRPLRASINARYSFLPGRQVHASGTHGRAERRRAIPGRPGLRIPNYRKLRNLRTSEPLDPAALEPLRTGRVNQWTGEIGTEFEQGLATWNGAKLGISTANGTAALHTALAP